MTITDISMYGAFKLYLIQAGLGVMLASFISALILLWWGWVVLVLWGYSKFKYRGKRNER